MLFPSASSRAQGDLFVNRAQVKQGFAVNEAIRWGRENGFDWYGSSLLAVMYFDGHSNACS